MPLQSLHPPNARTGCCPHLGIQDDPETCLNYPAEWNLCYHARPVSPVSLEHQRKMCLSPVFTRCPVYAREHRTPLPRSLRLARAINWLRWALLTALLLIVAIGLWSAWREGNWLFPLERLIRFQAGAFAPLTIPFSDSSRLI